MQFEELVIKYSEKESFFKSFLLFFTVILLFLLFIFYDKYKSEETHIRNDIFLKLKNYSLSLKGNEFHKSIINKQEQQKFFTLYEDNKSLYILTPVLKKGKKEMVMVATTMGAIIIPYSKRDSKVNKFWYPRKEYQKLLKNLKLKLIKEFLLFLMGAIAVSLLAAWYTLKPLRNSLHLLEEFIKDVIHDLNTPLSSILLNLKMLNVKNEEIESITTATKTIEMLHHNLNSYLKEDEAEKESFSVKDIIEKYRNFFAPLYDYINWKVELEECKITTNKKAFERIIYNLLSNACKYNKSDGTIEMTMKEDTLTIKNSSYGVVNPQRVFERFYKEGERGLGIGLHIVEKLCKQLGIEKKFFVEEDRVIVILNCKSILS